MASNSRPEVSMLCTHALQNSSAPMWFSDCRIGTALRRATAAERRRRLAGRLPVAPRGPVAPREPVPGAAAGGGAACETAARGGDAEGVALVEGGTDTPTDARG